MFRFSLVVLGAALLAGCGGGGGSSKPSAAASITNTYNFVTPALNSQRTYAKTIVDNSNNTINESVVDTISTVNVDGSFTIHTEDPNHNSITVNGTVYSVPTETTTVNNSGHETSYSVLSNAPVTCTFTPEGPGPNYPFAVGDTWSSSWNLACGNNTPINFTQTGSVVDTESVTVPAGTFATFKLQSTISWTDAKGTTHTDSRTTWKDINSSHTTIKELDSYSYSGTVPINGRAVTTTRILQSQS